MSHDLRMRKGKPAPIGMVVCWVLILAVFFGGCSSLRKKFTRKKKEKDVEQSEFIPVLQPEEYPEKTASPAELYKYHFSLYEVWEKDLQTSLSESESQKRKEYTLNQLISQADSMAKLLNSEKQKGLVDIQSQLVQLQEKLKSPPAMRNDVDVKRHLESIGKQLRENYRFRDVQNNLISEQDAARMSF